MSRDRAGRNAPIASAASVRARAAAGGGHRPSARVPSAARPEPRGRRVPSERAMRVRHRHKRNRARARGAEGQKANRIRNGPQRAARYL